MKLKNLAGAFLALAFTACGAHAFAAGGDITEIWPVGETDLEHAVTPVSTATYPLKAGNRVRFAIRLGKRTPTDRPWRLAHIGTLHTEDYDAIVNPMRVGIYVSGVPHYATFDGEIPYDTYTDFYFTYTVQHGDFALPVVLAVGTSSPKPAVGDKLRETEYYFDPKGAAAWQFNNSALDNPGSGEKATMSFKQSVDIENPDYDLRGAGFYVKTIDFEGVEEGKTWRSVEAGTTKCDQTPRLAVDNYTALTNPVTLYVWSLDESVVRLTGAGVKPMQITYPDSSTKVERQVLTAKLNRGDSEFPFKLEAGDDAEGKTTQLVLCAFPDFTYAPATGIAYVDYTTATVAVTPKSDPYMTLTKVGDEDAKRIDLKATSDYYVSTALQLQFSQPYTNGDVKVSLRQFFGETEATAEDDVVAGKYLSFHLDPDADPTSDPSLEYVTVPKDSTDPVRFYVFALGSSVKTRKSPYLTLKPDLYADQPEAVTNFFAAGRSHQRNLAVKLDDQAPVIVQPKADTAYTAGAGSTFTVGLQISDNWRDLQESWATNGYSVTVEGMGVSKFTTNAVHFADGELLTIEPTASEEGGEAVIRVTDPEGHQAETVTIEVNVIPRPRAEVLFYTDSTRQTRHFGDFYEHDAATPYYLDISFNKGTAPANMYAFLVPQDANASNLVQCAAVSNGLYIAQGYTNSESAVAISFLDGFAAQNPMSARFKVVFKSTPTIDDPEAVDYTDGCGNPVVGVKAVNRPSTVTAVKLDTESVKDGGTFYNVPAMIQKKFRAKVADLSEIDLKYGPGYEGKEVWVRFEYTDDWNGWEQAPSKNLYATNGLSNYAELDVSFTYEGTVQRVNVYALDKDSRASGVEMGELEWGEPLFTFYVSVAAPQRVIIHDKQKKAVTDEDELVYSEDQMQVLSASSGDFYISLSSQPGSGKPPISKENPIRVKVTLEQYGDGVLDIHTNYLYYTTPADMAMKPVRINTATLNGGRESVWWMTAEVDMEDPGATDVDGHPWNEHFAAASCMVRVRNVDPVIDTATAKGTRTWSETGTNTVAVGEAITVNWKITDITNDFYEADWKDDRFQIEWSVDSGDAAKYPNPQVITNDWPRKKGIASKGQISGDYQFNIPDMSGTSTIKMTVTDGDGGFTEKEWIIYVSPSKRAKIGVYGPRATAESKYKAAKGVGQGLVAAKGTIALCEQFAQTWEYDETTADAEFYAFGYPATNTWAQFLIDYEIPTTTVTPDNTKDEGKIPGYLGYTTLHGVPLNRLGNKRIATDTTWYDWATHGGTDPDAGRYDSYFYRWVVTKDTSADKGGDTEPAAPAPTLWPFDGTSKTFTLDAGNGENKSGPVTYGTVGIEAIFARELRERDNLGDINADGIPDKIVELYGIGAEAVGTMPENDLDSLSAFNDDEDFLPNTAGAAIYSSLIPGLPDSWGEGLEFTARMEVRGFHDGLNDGAKLAGLSQYRFDAGFYSDDVEVRKVSRDYSDVEMMAWAEHGYAKDWSPERPTDPTKEDTDEDKFPDGYEYYFWYKAHVGYIENGVHRYMTGRAYDPRNPGEGTFIDSATIARMMDPRHDLAPVDFPEGYIDDASDAKTRDTDNDGLPDALEFEIGTNPFDFDTDGDGLPDGWEVMISGTNPLKVYTTGSISDAMRNFDGDAMAFTTPKLERDTVMPKPLHTDDLFSFALVKPDGDTDGIQWYVGKAAPTNVAVGETGVACTLLTVGSQAYVTTKGVATFTTADGRIVLATDLAKDSTWTAIKPDDKDLEPFGLEIEDGYVRLMPTRIPAGTVLAGEPEAEQTCYTLVFGGDVKDVNAAWVYGHEVDGTTTGNNLANQGGFGMLAIGRYEDAKAGVPIAALPKADENVAYLHYLVYQEFGFDPRTAWNANTPLGVRWGTAKSDGTAKDNVYDAKSGYAGIATRTREYTAYDEFLVFSFFLNNGMKVLTYEMLGDTAPTMAELWYANTTNPQGPGETVDTDGADAEGEAAKYWGRGSDNGADTDGDGVPDGWELYVMAGKKANGKYHFAFPYEDGYYSSFGPFMPHAKDAGKTDSNATSGFDSIAGDNDGLTEYQEFEGTDSTGYYMDETRAPATPTIVHDATWTWFNKFFPTDPWDEDTDKDGLKDADEKGKFGYGEPADNGKRKSIPGGGLNPCSVDTDQDGLPDGWEAQFPGNKSSLYAGEDADYAPDAAGNQGNPLQGLTDGMDGTVRDAYNTVYVNRTTSTAAGNEAYSLVVSIDGAKQVVDRDYDHDGLENWQEYLVGAMRCWRYDDPLSRWTSIPTEWYYDEDGIFNPFREDGRYLRLLGIDTSAEDEGRGEFWYRTLYDKTSPAYNPHLVTGTGSGAQYFSRVTNGFDPNFTDTGTYYIFHDRVNDAKIEDLWGFKAAPQKYISCSPVKADTDGDGMDDYYELFHGLNPLLGGVGRRTGNELIDVVYDAWYVENADSPVGDAEKNLWTLNAGRLLGREPRTNDPKNNKYDFELFPWLAGLAGADPDGDDLRNQDESLMPMVAPSDQYHHTDPTPLWMTDSSYTNSFVSRFYKLPATFTDIVLMRDTFEYDGKEWPFYDRDGFYFDAMGGCHLAPFTADHWNLTSVSSKNWAFSFEENEGYDTDHDGISDFEELKRVPTGTVSDPQEADSPHRRQAMYFAGPDRPSALQTMPFVKEGHPRYGYGYPDDMSLREYTVECWVRPESAADATVIERAIWSSYSAAGDEELMRKNFQIAIRGGCWYTKFDANGTLEDSLVELQSTKPAKVGEWTHVAATYDGAVLRLYVNGEEALKDGISGRGLTPEYGSSAVVVYPGSGATLTNGLYVGRDDRYWFDVEYPLHAIIIGASAKTQADFGGPTQVHNSHLNVMNGRGWDRYRDFFRGYVDEVRIWDGARKPGDIRADMMKRYTAADVSANRDKFYGDWAAGNRRYEKNGAKNPDVTPELRYHWTFDSLPGAENPEMAAKSAHGFGYVGADGETHAGSKAPLARPVGYEIAWWRQILDGYTGTVYCNPAYVTWVPNTVTHLPRFDTTTLDSFYWAGDTKGVVDGTYGFARTAEPVSRWTQYQRDGAFAMATTAGGTQTSEYSDFKTTPRRFWQANVDGIGNMSLLFEFTGRHLNQQGDDLLPLGGAYVKYVDAMWDGQGASTASEITGTDEDNNGLADWWQKYAVERYSPELAEGQEMKWTTFVTYRGRRMTAGEAYLLDLAHGLYADANGNIVTDPDLTKRFVNRADEDRDGLPDWWEKRYGIHTGDTVPTGTAHANEDPDNDGLSNYNEFLLSEVFDFAGLVFDPTRTCSVDEYTPDYFYRVGELYVGEIFADHDLVDDAWEDIYGNDFASRLAWDAFADADRDGWSNRSENRYSKAVMPIVADQREHYTAADGLVADYPIPTLSLTLSYNGNRQDAVRKAPMAIQVTTDTTLAKDPDATYLIGAAADKTAGTGTTSTEGTGASSSTETSHTRTIGKWSNRHAIGTLTPGNIKQNSLALEFCYDPSSVVYSWRVWPLGRGSYYEDKRGTRLEYDAEKRKYGDANIEFVGADTSYAQLKDLEVRPGEDSSTAIWFHTKSGLELGTVNLVTGEFDLNLGVFKDQYVENGTNESDYVSLEDQTFRIAYAANPSVGLPRALYLGAADTGYVREGKNTIVAWAETVTADGKWQVGEPYGIVRDVDVSWRGTKAEIELTDISPVTPRIDLVANDGEPKMTFEERRSQILSDRQWDPQIQWVSNNVIESASVEASSFRGQRIRVVRWLVNDVPVYLAGCDARVILDRKIETDVRTCITEADFLVGANDVFDLDCANLRTEVVTNPDVRKALAGEELTSVTYLIVVGEGAVEWETSTDTTVVRALDQVIVRKFGENRVTPDVVAPGTEGAIVNSANPTFKWRMDCPEEEGYTAFRIQVTNGLGKVVFDSDKQLAPPRNDKGQYEWSAPLYVGDKTTSGEVFENKKVYGWKVAMYNAKFSQDGGYSAAGKFFMEVQTNGTDYGTANVAVRYFGPTETYAKWSPVVRVQAFTSPDFTGRPVAAGFVEDVTTLTNANRELAANCRVIGFEPGSYYLQAFVDSNGNGICDPWETQGYLCARDGSTADWLDPTTISFAKSVGAGDLAVIYLEDADTDGDGLPDAWEWATASETARANGTFLNEKGVDLLTETKAGERLYSMALTRNQELKLQDGASWPDGGLEGLLGSRFLNNAGMVYLAMGAPAGKGGFTEAIEAALAPELEEGGVTIRELGLRDGRVTVALGIETTSGAETPLAKFFDAGGKLTVVCEILWTPSLAQDPKVIYSEDVVVGDEPAEFDISAALEKAQAEAGVDGGSAFFSARVYKK